MTADPDKLQQQAKALGDPSRFRIFEHIHSAGDAVPIADLTALLGFNHNAIRQHLAVLVGAGLIAETTETRTVRGRPRKLYHARDDALNVFASISGSHEQLASLLLEFATSSAAPYEVGRAAVTTTDAGIDASTDHATLLDHLDLQLARTGFEPRRTDDNQIELGHCPFAALASRNPEVICELHRGLIDGHLATVSGDLAVRLEPRDPATAGCMVDIRPAAS